MMNTARIPFHQNISDIAWQIISKTMLYTQENKKLCLTLWNLFSFTVYADHARKEYEANNATSKTWWKVQVSKDTVVKLLVYCSTEKFLFWVKAIYKLTNIGAKKFH